jgi:3'-phosphoadenosine 5'-phosphosulfate (PAPS) 3'-phosphatase
MVNVSERALSLLPALSKAMNEVVRMRSEPDFQVIQKEDGSPVTSADLWANEFLLGAITSLFPDEALLGEESLSTDYPIHAEWLWFIDPIDGTKHYLSGHNPFYMLIGLCHWGEPVMGICAYPSLGKIVVGGHGFPAEVWYQDGDRKRLPLSKSWHDKDHHTLTLKGFSDQEKVRVGAYPGIVKAKPVYQHPSMMGAAYELSDGFLDRRSIHYWDLCAPAAIMRSLEYEVGRTIDNKCLMNDGSIRTPRFHCLPKDTPDAIKELVYQA